MTTLDRFTPTFHRTSDGYLAARLDRVGYLALPASDGLTVVESLDPLRPTEQWTRADGWVRVMKVPDECGFRSYVLEIAADLSERAALNRRQSTERVDTPWGRSQSVEVYDEGVISVSTAGHGGFNLTPERNACVHSLYRVANGWYEEDCEWAKVAATFPRLFTARERRLADRILRNYEPDAYEAVTGVTLAPGESRSKDKRRFAEAHANDWVVTSAINSHRRPGFVECTAKLAGDHRARETRRFLVPVSEYETNPFGFVIDLARHEADDEPRSPRR